MNTDTDAVTSATKEEKAYAKQAVRRAIEKGVLNRPKYCGKCGLIPPVCADGRAAIQAHHHDYSRPLDVEWICAKCHRKETPLPAVVGAPNFGEKNGNAKLTRQIVEEIRRSPLGLRPLAKLYGVSRRTIQCARRGLLWKSVDDVSQPISGTNHDR